MCTQKDMWRQSYAMSAQQYYLERLQRDKQADDNGVGRPYLLKIKNQNMDKVQMIFL